MTVRWSYIHSRKSFCVSKLEYSRTSSVSHITPLWTRQNPCKTHCVILLRTTGFAGHGCRKAQVFFVFFLDLPILRINFIGKVYPYSLQSYLPWLWFRTAIKVHKLARHVHKPDLQQPQCCCVCESSLLSPTSTYMFHVRISYLGETL